jgi:hypothetical protein
MAIKYSGVFLGVLVSTLLVVGCAKNKYPVSSGELVGNVDCRACHTPKLAPGARDFSALYIPKKSHHPLGARYFAGGDGGSAYLYPTVARENVSFFDTNGNGQPDANEIQLFGAKGKITVESASCHKPHGVAELPKEEGAYLRTSNQESALCFICHDT